MPVALAVLSLSRRIAPGDWPHWRHRQRVNRSEPAPPDAIPRHQSPELLPEFLYRNQWPALACVLWSKRSVREAVQKSRRPALPLFARDQQKLPSPSVMRPIMLRQALNLQSRLRHIFARPTESQWNVCGQKPLQTGVTIWVPTWFDWLPWRDSRVNPRARCPALRQNRTRRAISRRSARPQTLRHQQCHPDRATRCLCATRRSDLAQSRARVARTCHSDAQLPAINYHYQLMRCTLNRRNGVWVGNRLHRFSVGNLSTH